MKYFSYSDNILGARAELFQIWCSYSDYLFGIPVAIPSLAGVNELLGLLQISHSYSKFDAAIPSV